MKTTLLLALPFAIALVSGCGKDNTNNNTDMTTAQPDLSMPGPTDPVKPALGSNQIERMGRATINVAVTNPFDLDYSMVGPAPGGGANQAATRQMHSQDADVANWKTKWTPIIAETLRIYDGLETGATACGNQFGACGKATGCAMGDPVNAQRYDTLAGVLADDQLYIDTTKTNCGFYLAVEANVLMVPGTNAFCGGRTPLHDTVDVMYTAASVGAAGFPTMANPQFGVRDGVAADGETQDSLTVFPFLSDPT